MVEENQRACKLGCFHQEELTLNMIKYNLKTELQPNLLNTTIELIKIIFTRNRNAAKIDNNIPAIKASGSISGKAIIFTISTGDPEAPGYTDFKKSSACSFN